MKLLRRLSEIFKKALPGERREGGASFLSRYQSFRELLTQNNYVLELMADLEEKLSGEYLIDSRYTDHQVKAIATGVKKVIDELKVISNNGYPGLQERFEQISSALEELLTAKKEIPFSKFTVPFDEIDKEMADVVGAKNANLGEVRNRLRMPTPDGFAVTNFAFKRFMEHNGFLANLRETLDALRTDNLELLNHTSKAIQEQIVQGEIPQEIEREVLDAYSSLCDKRGREVRVSVRSSALQEDGTFSFAGQYATFLNVSSGSLLQKYKEVVASLFTSRAIFYYKMKGLQEYELAMSVGVLEMVDAKAAGVVYSRDPNEPGDEALIINAVRGMGRCAVDGVVTPETYTVSKSSFEIFKRTIPEESGMVVCGADGKLESAPLPENLRGAPSLDDAQIRTLARYATLVEMHYQYPQDIEWAIDTNGGICLLQARPLMVTARVITKPAPSHITGYDVLIDKGIIACKGIGFGKAFLVRTEEDLKDFPDGAVLVAGHTSARFVTVMNKAAAIVTDIGGATVHLATLAREFQVPSIFDTGVATKVIKSGQEITVDAINCNVYDGLVKELSEFSTKREEPFKETQFFKTLEKALGLIVPLRLIDPYDEGFTTGSCETFHDIIRFAHQKAMQEMFRISAELPEGVEAVKLVAGIPLAVYVIDFGGGAERTIGKLLPGHIRSIPFKAFLRGMSSVEWPEPRHVDVKGFLGMMAHTASVPEEELEQMGEESLSFISGEYMNFSVRLGYHLSVVEAYNGENLNDNYVRFFFKGGGAGLERRLRRVRLISGILKRLDFEIRVTEDIVDAVLTKYKSAQLERKLEILGRMTVYTKQMDAILFDDASVEKYFEQFVIEHLEAMIE